MAKRPIESWDFRRAIPGAEDYDVETDLFLSEHFTNVIATDATRVGVFPLLLDNDVMTVSDDREHLIPVWEPRAVDGFLSGIASTQSRFSSDGRFYRGVVSGMRREFADTGQIRVELLPGYFTRGLHRSGSPESG